MKRQFQYDELADTVQEHLDGAFKLDMSLLWYSDLGEDGWYIKPERHTAVGAIQGLHSIVCASGFTKARGMNDTCNVLQEALNELRVDATRTRLHRWKLDNVVKKLLKSINRAMEAEQLRRYEAGLAFQEQLLASAHPSSKMF